MAHWGSWKVRSPLAEGQLGLAAVALQLGAASAAAYLWRSWTLAVAHPRRWWQTFWPRDWRYIPPF